MNMKEYGFAAEQLPEGAKGIPARITAVHRDRYELVCEYGETRGKLKTKEYYLEGEIFPTTGDFVLIQYNPSGESQILQTLPRSTFFSRKDPTAGRGEQAVAANFHYVFIIQSMNRDFNVKRLERYLTLAWQSGALPVIILTKADLVEDPAEYVALAERYAVGVPVHVISARTGEGLETLKEYMAPGKTAVFLGSSGVGKSSLVNALAGEEIMDVSGIREADSRGRHTTTYRQLIRLQSGAMIIDTPGMRELGMWDVSEGLGETFADVEQFFGLCRFSDCKHENEPGCAIRSAIVGGELSQERWDSYRKLKNEATYADDKQAFLKQKTQRNRDIAMRSRERKNYNAKRGGKR